MRLARETNTQTLHAETAALQQGFELPDNQVQGIAGQIAVSEIVGVREPRDIAADVVVEPAPKVEIDISAITDGGWRGNDDTQLHEIRGVASAYGFTSIAFARRSRTGRIGFAAHIMSDDPTTLVIGPRHQWSEQRWKQVRETRMPEAMRHGQVVYRVGHEAGHLHHYANGYDYDRSASALATLAAENSLTRPDGRGWTAADFDIDGNPVALEALLPFGLSPYGTTDIAELVGELHASFQLGGDTPLVRTIARAEGWTRIAPSPSGHTPSFLGLGFLARR